MSDKLADYRGNGGATDIEIPEGMHIPSEHVDAEPTARPKSARESMMEEIAAKRMAIMEAEFKQAEIYDRDAIEAGLTLPQDDDDAPAPVASPAAPVVTPAAPAPVAVAPQPPAQVAAPTMRTVNIDGHQWQVSEDQFASLAQQGLIANRALQDYQRTQQQQPAYQPAPVQPPVDPERVRDTVKKLQFANEDEAAAALTTLISDVVQRTPAPQHVDQGAIVRAAVTEAQRAAQLERDNAIIREEFADVFAHPARSFLAAHNVNAIRQRNAQFGQAQSEIEVYREAGRMAREAMGTMAPQAAPVADPVQANRQATFERKRALPSRPQPVDARQAAPAAPRAPSGSDIVEQMRKGRHQMSMR